MNEIDTSGIDFRSEDNRYYIQRDGKLDLAFVGLRIGCGGDADDWDAVGGTVVDIYLTETGRLVTHVRRWSGREGERARHTAAVHADAASAVGWLYEDGDGYLYPAAKEAWSAACRRIHALWDAEVEWV